MSNVILLGPQRERPTAPASARTIAGPIAVITAGWQENENDTLPRGFPKGGTNLAIYRRAEEVFDQDRELFQAHRERQLRLKQLQRLYRVRLDHAIAAYRDLVVLRGDGELLEAERGAALESLRALDRHHLEGVGAIHAQFEAEWQPSRREAVAAQREELAGELEKAEGVVIAGGHVAVLLNRVRLFDLGPLFAGKTIVAWSAGAMLTARRIVLFHDSPPWGAGNAEVLDFGLDLCGDVLPLPDAERRLLTGDPQRVAQMSRRFAPLACVGLAEESLLRRDADGWQAREAQLLAADGRARRVGPSSWEVLEW
jgi:hypothetical protein